TAPLNLFNDFNLSICLWYDVKLIAVGGLSIPCLDTWYSFPNICLAGITSAWPNSSTSTHLIYLSALTIWVYDSFSAENSAQYKMLRAYSAFFIKKGTTSNEEKSVRCHINSTNLTDKNWHVQIFAHDLLAAYQLMYKWASKLNYLKKWVSNGVYKLS
ncbi:hypothetical protein ACJX0J_016455, partial [Zea mays]